MEWRQDQICTVGYKRFISVKFAPDVLILKFVLPFRSRPKTSPDNYLCSQYLPEIFLASNALLCINRYLLWFNCPTILALVSCSLALISSILLILIFLRYCTGTFFKISYLITKLDILCKTNFCLPELYYLFCNLLKYVFLRLLITSLEIQGQTQGGSSTSTVVWNSFATLAWSLAILWSLL
jgi:hypothetical protein